MKIKSVSDVITNSSSEVYSLPDRGSVVDLKRMIDLILEISGSPKRCDDFFEIRLTPNEWAVDDYNPEDLGGRPWEELSEEEKIQYCLDFSDPGRRELYLEVEIIPKTTDIPSELIRLLSRTVDTGLSNVEVYFG